MLNWRLRMQRLCNRVPAALILNFNSSTVVLTQKALAADLGVK